MHHLIGLWLAPRLPAHSRPHTQTSYHAGPKAHYTILTSYHAGPMTHYTILSYLIPHRPHDTLHHTFLPRPMTQHHTLLPHARQAPWHTTPYILTSCQAGPMTHYTIHSYLAPWHITPYTLTSFQAGPMTQSTIPGRPLTVYQTRHAPWHSLPYTLTSYQIYSVLSNI